MIKRLAIGCVLAFTASAHAQSNSLFREQQQTRGQQAGNTEPQPDAPAVEILFVGPQEFPPPRVKPDDAKPLENEVLLYTSLIAVETPPEREIRVHDIITVIVREDRRSVSDAKMSADKKWELESELSAWVRLADGNLVPQVFEAGNPAAAFEYDNQYEGNGKSERSDSLTTRIAAKIIDIKPNGNLIIQARKEIKSGEETHFMVLTGECAKDNVTPQRTVLSTQIYDLRIDMPDRGAVRDATRRGWLMRLLDAVRPF